MPARKAMNKVLRKVGRKPAPAPRHAPWVSIEPNPADAQPLDEIRLFAVMGTWMEADIVASTVRNAFLQGCERVYLVDNDSPDDTVAVAEDAGATLAVRFHTDEYDEALRLQLMNDVARSVGQTDDLAQPWWLFLDADEFPHATAGRTVKQHLETLDQRFRVVGARFLNHYPTSEPAFVEGGHPLRFQPMCEEQPHKFCTLNHRKHPLLRFDREGPAVEAGLGFHRASTSTGELLLEPDVGLIEHHFPYRTYEASRARLDALCGSGRAREDDIATGHMLPRFRSLDAVYEQRWDEVENFLPGRPPFGVELHDWTELVAPEDADVPTWDVPAPVDGAPGQVL